ncbi:MAG: hypothetical protein HYX61_07895 [Gammaproteobacteria bacterium]|jgi:hypothetical protein|nr:hypothetical protein [Gammaproteobacteria bacterium]
MSFLFFAPYNAIWQHALPEATVAKTLQDAGKKITYMSCNGIFNQYCIAMSAYGLTPESTIEQKKKVCYSCKKHTKLLTTNIADKLLFIEDYISDADTKEIEQQLLQLDADKSNGKDCFTEPLRQFATYTLILTHKLIDKQKLIEDKYYLQYRNEYKQVLISYYAAMNYFKNNSIEGVFTYNSFYPTNRTVVWVAALHQIPVYWLHAGGSIHNRLHTLNIGKGHHYNILHSWLANWQTTYKNKPASKAGINHVTQHYLALLEGINIFVYSGSKFKPEGMHAFFNIPKDKKIISAVLSSQDERIAVESIKVLEPQKDLCFKSQLDWVQELICFASKNTDIHLIIRVHPRDFPNRRDSVLSVQAQSLQKILTNLPGNVSINWPSDNVSLYQLATITDVCVHAGSSVGKEFSLLGIPTVNYMNNGLSYPHNLSFWGSTKEEYFVALNQALKTTWSLDTAITAFRWSSLELYEGLWFLDNNFSELNENKKFPLIKRIIRKLHPYLLKKISCRKIKSIKEHKLLLELIDSQAISRLGLSDTQTEENKDPFNEQKAIFDSLEIILSRMYQFVRNKEDFKLLQKINAAKMHTMSMATTK